MEKPTPAARIAMKPAKSRRLAFGVIPVSFVIVGLMMFWVCLCLCKFRQLHNFAALQSRFVGAKADAGPVCGFACVRERVAMFNQGADELMRQMRVRAAMACALSEA